MPLRRFTRVCRRFTQTSSRRKYEMEARGTDRGTEDSAGVQSTERTRIESSSSSTASVKGGVKGSVKGGVKGGVKCVVNGGVKGGVNDGV